MCTLSSARFGRYSRASWVSFGGGGGAGFGPNVYHASAPASSTPARPTTMPMGEILTSGNRHLSDHDRRRRNGAAELKIITDLRHSRQHLLQRARDRDFRNGKRQLAIANPDPHRAARIIPRHRIDTAADQFGHKKSVRDPAQH